MCDKQAGLELHIKIFASRNDPHFRWERVLGILPDGASHLTLPIAIYFELFELSVEKRFNQIGVFKVSQKCENPASTMSDQGCSASENTLNGARSAGKENKANAGVHPPSDDMDDGPFALHVTFTWLLFCHGSARQLRTAQEVVNVVTWARYKRLIWEK